MQALVPLPLPRRCRVHPHDAFILCDNTVMSDALDGNPSGVHVDKDDFGTCAGDHHVSEEAGKNVNLTHSMARLLLTDTHRWRRLLIETRQQDSRDDRVQAACTRTARLRRRSNACSGLTDPSSQGTLTVCSVRCWRHVARIPTGTDSACTGHLSPSIPYSSVLGNVFVPIWLCLRWRFAGEIYHLDRLTMLTTMPCLVNTTPYRAHAANATFSSVWLMSRIMSHSHSPWSAPPPFPLPQHIPSPHHPSRSDEQPLDPRTAGRSGRLAV